jgi:hypothetical protein
MSVHFACTLGLSAGLLLCLPGTLDAADFSKLEVRGKAILQEKCDRCHAIEAVGESPLSKAPPMRDIYARFNPKARSPSTRKCRRSTFRTRTCKPSLPISMLLRLGNEIGPSDRNHA